MNKIKLTKHKLWTKGKYVRTAVTFFINFAVIMGILLLSVYLNGIGPNKVDTGFRAYFANSYRQFLYLGLTVLIVLGVFIAYLYIEYRDFAYETKNVVMLFVIIELTLLTSYFAGRYVSIYFRPLAMGALLVLLLARKRIAIFTNFIICLIVFLMDIFTNYDCTKIAIVSDYAQYSSLIVGFVSGTVAVFLVDGCYSRLRVLAKGSIIVAPIILCLLLLEQIPVRWTSLLAGASSGIISVILFVALLPIFEITFNKVTNYKLAELTDHQSPLIKRLIEDAPGTFNHSIVVSTLAEACATDIGENSILARCAAYYHDIGKLHQPEFFKENQSDGKNSHDEITPELSTNIIRSHTKDGYELIKKYHLPTQLGDICLQHHGTMPILYFYSKAKKYTEGEVNIEDFSYTGPKPQTKIAAIIMICDSCEAAVRTLKDRSRDKVDKAVEKIIEERLELDQFDECEITMKELNIIRNTIVNNLTGVYHKRIEYPKINVEKLKKVSEDKDE